MAEKEVWDKPNPNKKSKPLTPYQKAKAKARAKAAGRPYPNLIDNMAVAKEALEIGTKEIRVAYQRMTPGQENADIGDDTPPYVENNTESEKTNLRRRKAIKRFKAYFDEQAGCDCFDDLIEEEVLFEEKKVKLNKPFRTPGGPKKFSVYVRNDKGNIVKVNFGDPNMEIKRDDPARRRNFRARHNCSNPGPKWKARYWSCRMWSSTKVSDLD